MTRIANKFFSLTGALLLAGGSLASHAAPVNLLLDGDFTALSSNSNWVRAGGAGRTDAEDHTTGGSEGRSIRFDLARDLSAQSLTYVPSLALTGGVSYTLSFWLNSAFYDQSNLFAEFSFVNVNLAPVSFDVALTKALDTSPWVQYSYDFTVATDTAFALSFATAPLQVPDGAEGQIYLDDVALVQIDVGCTVNCNPVPEPGTAALVGVALMAGIYVGRRRKM